MVKIWGWPSQGLGQGYGSGYSLDVLQEWVEETILHMVSIQMRHGERHVKKLRIVCCLMGSALFLWGLVAEKKEFVLVLHPSAVS